MSSSGTTATVFWAHAVALHFVACVDTVLGAAQAEVASDPQAGIVTIFSTYIYWLDFAESSVIWEGQAAVLEECQELFQQYGDKEWVVSFEEHFISDHH